MEQRFLKFQESKQAAVKLAIAAEDFYSAATPPEYLSVYCEYLRSRLRPAAELLVRQEDTDRLQKLWDLQCFPEGMLNELLKLSSREKKNASYMWLLRKKGESFGFPPRDYSL